MAWLTDLDAAIQACLAGVRVDSRAAFRTVAPLRATGRSPVPDAMLAADKPALFHAIRRLSEPKHGVLAEVQALLIAEGLRGQEAAWRGDGQVLGAYALAEAAARGLVQLRQPDIGGVWLRHQQLAYADGRIVAFAQEYHVMQAGERLWLDGNELIGWPCQVQLVEAAATSQWQAETVAGSEQHWAAWQGRGPETISFEGTLWATDETGLAAIERRFETLLRSRTHSHLTTAAGQTWHDVALVSWQRRGARVAQPMLGLLGQQVRMDFEQYRP